MSTELIEGILIIILLTGIMAVPWILIGWLIGNREEVVSPLRRIPRYKRGPKAISAKQANDTSPEGAQAPVAAEDDSIQT